jgi:hypothetical protein
MSITWDVCFRFLPQKLQNFNTDHVSFFFTTFVQNISHSNKYFECCELVTPKMNMEMHVSRWRASIIIIKFGQNLYADAILVQHKFHVNPFGSSWVATYG